MFPSNRSRINILSVPFNSSLENVIRFNSRSQQYSYMTSKTIRSDLGTQYHVRENNDVGLMVEMNIAELEGANYISFINNDKWYYAFIVDKEYINDRVTSIYFEIDVWQTYQFDINIHNSFVEREHVNSDKIGENIVKEPINYGLGVRKKPIKMINVSDADKFKENVLFVIFSSFENAEELDKEEVLNWIIPRTVDHFLGRVTAGVQRMYFVNKEGMKELTEDINKLPDKGANTIIGMYQIPRYIFEGDQTPSYKTLESFSAEEEVLSIGYRPKNNKLYTGQFIQHHVSNAVGDMLSFTPDEVDYKRPVVKANFYFGQNPTTSVFVENLKTSTMESISLAPYESVAWAGNTYAEYQAQNERSKPTSLWNAVTNIGGRALGGGITGGAMGGPWGAGIGAVGGAVSGLFSLIGSVREEEDMTNQFTGLRGNASTSSVWASGKENVYAFSSTLSKEDFKRADDFLTRYGYQVNTFKKPNLTGRKYFNFVKTGECNITGPIPEIHMQKIIALFNRGITLWHGSENFGNLSLNNPIV